MGIASTRFFTPFKHFCCQIAKSIWKNAEDYSSQIDLDELQGLFKVTSERKQNQVTESIPGRGDGAVNMMRLH